MFAKWIQNIANIRVHMYFGWPKQIRFSQEAGEKKSIKYGPFITSPMGCRKYDRRKRWVFKKQVFMFSEAVKAVRAQYPVYFTPTPFHDINKRL